MKRMIWMALGDVGKLERILQIGLSIVHSVNLCSDHFSSHFRNHQTNVDGTRFNLSITSIRTLDVNTITCPR